MSVTAEQVARETLAQRKRRAASIARALAKQYPDATCALHFSNPLELLVATILSAQCTDQRVNKVTPEVFRKYPTARHYARAPRSELEKAIQSTGFFRNKAKAIQECCRVLDERYGGQVPREIDALVQLPGVGRKTANVVLGTAYGIASGVVVDTHVGRIVRRLGLTEAKQPDRIEQDLMELLPQSQWIDFAHRLIHHGRQVCSARRPKCDRCVLLRWCPRIGVTEPAGASDGKPPRKKKAVATASGRSTATRKKKKAASKKTPRRKATATARKRSS